MEIELFLFIFSAAFAAWGTWAYVSNIYDKRIEGYSAVIANFDVENNLLRRQVEEAQRAIQSLSDNPRVKELEKRIKDLGDQRQRVQSTINQIRNKIEANYASHSLGQYVLAELENISPSEKTLEAKHAAESRDVFRRIRHGLPGTAAG